MKLIAVLLFVLIDISAANALGLADFVPGFLVSAKVDENSGADDALPVQPLVNVKRNSSQGNSWYCTRGQPQVAGNVFCTKNDSSAVARMLTFESGNPGDTSQAVENSVIKSANPQMIGPATSSNQSTLQDQQVKNTLDKTQNNFSVPLQPGNGVKMNINQQQIEFNIKY